MFRLTGYFFFKKKTPANETDSEEALPHGAERVLPLLSECRGGLVDARLGGTNDLEAARLNLVGGVAPGGDAVTGAATVILAMGAGKQAAKEIDEYLKSV